MHAAAAGHQNADGLLRRGDDDAYDEGFLPRERKEKFTPKDIEGMKATAKLRAGDRNPYSWNMDFFEYEDAAATRRASRPAASAR